MRVVGTKNAAAADVMPAVEVLQGALYQEYKTDQETRKTFLKTWDRLLLDVKLQQHYYTPLPRSDVDFFFPVAI